MEIVKRWDYKGWTKYVASDSKTFNLTQMDWNCTLFSVINRIATHLGLPQGALVFVVVPNHLKEVLNANYELLKEDGVSFAKTVSYKDGDDDVIEVNGVGIEILNFG